MRPVGLRMDYKNDSLFLNKESVSIRMEICLWRSHFNVLFQIDIYIKFVGLCELNKQEIEQSK